MKLLVATQVIDKNDPILGFFHGWIEEFAKHFERIDVICLREGEHQFPAHVFVHSLGKEGGKNRLKYAIRFYTYFWKYYVKARTDFVLFHMGAIMNIIAAPFFFIRTLKKTKFIWWKTHGKVGHTKEMLALQFCDVVATAGSRSFDIPTKKLSIVGHAIDTQTFSPQSGTRSIPGRLLVVGRITPIKKIEVALEVADKIRKTHRPMELRIVGGVEDTSYKERLDRLVRELHHVPVTFVGPMTQNALLKEYRNASILIHPAYEAGFDKVVLEAMAIGVMPVTSIPSFEEVLSPFGLFVPAMDVTGYVSCIMRIEQMAPDEQEKLRRSLREIVLGSHSLTTSTQRIFTV